MPLALVIGGYLCSISSGDPTSIVTNKRSRSTLANLQRLSVVDVHFTVPTLSSRASSNTPPVGRLRSTWPHGRAGPASSLRLLRSVARTE
jgi:hypothetical protein